MEGRVYEKQIKEYNEMIEKEMAEKKAAYQSGEAYRRGSEDIIDVDYVGNENGEKLLKFIVQLVQSLGMKITAEGVEYKEQLDFLENLNCDDIQGFYFSKPLMLADFSAKLTENN